jgi:translation initiation factor IF-2
MALKLADLADQLHITPKELRESLKKAGFPVKPLARVIDEKDAESFLKVYGAKNEKPAQETVKSESLPAETPVAVTPSELEEIDEGPKDTAQLYGEIIDEEIDREIIYEQRKKMAGQQAPHRPSAKPQAHKKFSPAQHQQQNSQQRQAPQAAKSGIAEIPDVITVKEFAEKTGLSAVKVIGELMKNGILANINQQIDFDTAAIIASDLKVQIKRKRSDILLDDLSKGNLKAFLKQDDPDDLKPRPPIVVVMGHVDHGKTSLLDYIRESNVAAGEAGGITQHIAAYQVEKSGRKITFLDTPGHEAFTAMRARGAKVTDVAVLVVAADEGVMPQTVEALNHAKEAGVPIIVALNKIDKPHIQVDRVKGQLAEHGLQPEDWGGTTPMVLLSAHTGQGVPELLEMILLVTDMQNLKANPNREAVATVIEANLDKNLGPIATIVVNTGTLHVTDYIVVGASHGRIKTMKNQLGQNVTDAPPSTPVVISGLSLTPQSGDILEVVAGGEKAARERASQISDLRQEQALAKGAGLMDIMSQINAGALKTLKIVLKVDSQGSLEAIKQTLAAVKHDDVAIKIIHGAVGNVTESDVMMAEASGGIVIAFHVIVSPHVKRTAERDGVEILSYSIIYKLLEDLKNLLSGLLEPELVELVLGRGNVKQVFFRKRNEMIIGCGITNGKFENRAKLRVLRADKKIGDGEIMMLKKIDQQVKELQEGNDCGIKFVGNVDLQEGDVLEAYKIERKKRSL